MQSGGLENNRNLTGVKKLLNGGSASGCDLSITSADLLLERKELGMLPSVL